MGYRRHAIAPGEWYHCYTRGIDKRTVFQSRSDYLRFQQALYLSNSDKNIERGAIQHLSHQEILATERGNPLVAVGAYCLMPNHFHLLIKERREGGLTRFMQKLGTSYTMYFNAKNQRSGALFVGPFRSRHVDDDRYLSRVVPYIHLNAAEIFEHGWKKGKATNLKNLETNLQKYPYSSFQDYTSDARGEAGIIDKHELQDLLSYKMPPLNDLLPEMRDYYENLHF